MAKQRNILLLAILALAGFASSSVSANSNQANEKPNIVIFVADDLGWADDPHEKGNYVFRGSRLTPGNNQPGQSIAFPYASNRYSSDGIDETTFADLVLAAAAGDTSTGRVVETIDENGQVRLETGNSRDPQSPGQSRSRGVLSSTARRPLIRRRG